MVRIYLLPMLFCLMGMGSTGILAQDSRNDVNTRHHMRGRVERGGMSVEKTLNLTDDQRKALREERNDLTNTMTMARAEAQVAEKEYRERLRDVDASDSDVLGAMSKLAGTRENLLKLQTDHQLAIRKILDKDQLVKLTARSRIAGRFRSGDARGFRNHRQGRGQAPAFDRRGGSQRRSFMRGRSQRFFPGPQFHNSPGWGNRWPEQGNRRGFQRHGQRSGRRSFMELPQAPPGLFPDDIDQYGLVILDDTVPALPSALVSGISGNSSL